MSTKQKEDPWGSVIRIDRDKPFNPVAFLGKGWKIAEQDKRALSLVEVDLSQIILKHCFKKGERFIWEERLGRLKALHYIRLDAKVFQFFWENKKFIPESWKKLSWISFDGTILLNPFDHLHVLCLLWCTNDWYWNGNELGYSWSRNNPSALLPVSL